jgi:hypothetical protein
VKQNSRACRDTLCCLMCLMSNGRKGASRLLEVVKEDHVSAPLLGVFAVT